MKTTLIVFTIASLLIGCNNTNNSQHEHEAKTASSEKKPLSPRTASMAMIGSNHVHIDYGSPSKRGRMIFGGLVGYGSVWATGAHKATTIALDKNVNINGTEIPAGKYGLFTIPGETEWIIIINKVWDMHLADDYLEENDMVRITTPVQTLDEVVESLTFEVQETDTEKGRIIIKWDQTAVSFVFESK